MSQVELPQVEESKKEEVAALAAAEPEKEEVFPQVEETQEEKPQEVREKKLEKKKKTFIKTISAFHFQEFQSAAIGKRNKIRYLDQNLYSSRQIAKSNSSFKNSLKQEMPEYRIRSNYGTRCDDLILMGCHNKKFKI